MKIWLNGTLLPNGSLDASSAGLTLGWGVFTTLGIRGGAPRFLERHFERLRRDAHEAQIAFDFDLEAVRRAVVAVARANGVANGIARLTLTQRGDGRWNTQNGADFSIFALETSPQNEPLRVQLSPYRVEARRALAGVKTTSYLPYFWAWREAQPNGFDEAILRDGSDFLSEGARATLFWVKGGELFTPSLETGCLRGIGRDLTLEWARERSIAAHEGRFLAGEAENADEMWLVSAALGPRLVASWH
ncbi:MAG: aminotransferase class IV, partial [Armatimonadetes bacterium]|nr:aminotransferase class IV [Armatimonadota bacterium]